MCRYGIKTYKVHYGCFACRKVFRRTSPAELMEQDGVYDRYRRLAGKLRGASNAGTPADREKLAELEAAYFHRTQVCPDCGGTMADLGMDFKAPKRTDAKRWRIAEGMFRMGFAFQSCGCNGPGYIPSNPTDYRRYLDLRKAQYQESLAAAEKGNSDSQPGDRAEAVKYWAERLELVERAILEASQRG